MAAITMPAVLSVQPVHKVLFLILAAQGAQLDEPVDSRWQHKVGVPVLGVQPVDKVLDSGLVYAVCMQDGDRGGNETRWGQGEKSGR